MARGTHCAPVQACVAEKTKLDGEGGRAYVNSKTDLPVWPCHLNDRVIVQFNMTCSEDSEKRRSGRETHACTAVAHL